MDDHQTIGIHTHSIQHFAMVNQLLDGSLDHCDLWAPQLGILTGMDGEPMSILLRKGASLRKKLRTVLQRVPMNCMRCKRKHFRREPEETNILVQRIRIMIKLTKKRARVILVPLNHSHQILDILPAKFFHPIQTILLYRVYSTKM